MQSNQPIPIHIPQTTTLQSNHHSRSRLLSLSLSLFVSHSLAQSLARVLSGMPPSRPTPADPACCQPVPAGYFITFAKLIRFTCHTHRHTHNTTDYIRTRIRALIHKHTRMFCLPLFKSFCPASPTVFLFVHSLLLSCSVCLCPVRLSSVHGSAFDVIFSRVPVAASVRAFRYIFLYLSISINMFIYI